jgi:hypothetical protein
MTAKALAMVGGYVGKKLFGFKKKNDSENGRQRPTPAPPRGVSWEGAARSFAKL